MGEGDGPSLEVGENLSGELCPPRDQMAGRNGPAILVDTGPGRGGQPSGEGQNKPSKNNTCARRRLSSGEDSSLRPHRCPLDSRPPCLRVRLRTGGLAAARPVAGSPRARAERRPPEESGREKSHGVVEPPGRGAERELAHAAAALVLLGHGGVRVRLLLQALRVRRDDRRDSGEECHDRARRAAHLPTRGGGARTPPPGTLAVD